MTRALAARRRSIYYNNWRGNQLSAKFSSGSYVSFPLISDLANLSGEIIIEYKPDLDQQFLNIASTNRFIAASFNSQRGASVDQLTFTAGPHPLDEPEENSMSVNGLTAGELYKIEFATDSSSEISKLRIDGKWNGMSTVSASRVDGSFNNQHRIGTRKSGNFPYSGSISYYSVDGFGRYRFNNNVDDIDGGANSGTASGVTYS